MSIQDFIPKLPPARVRHTPVGPVSAPFFSFGLLTLACALASLAFACATPFAAFAVMAAEKLPLSSALLVVAAAWVVNQAIGFGALHYPVDANTIAWGLAIGAAALAGTATCEDSGERCPSARDQCARSFSSGALRLGLRTGCPSTRQRQHFDMQP